jgi:hypothetical protein
MVHLNQEQQHLVDSGAMPELVDPRTNKKYMLVDAETFSRVKQALGVAGRDWVDTSLPAIMELFGKEGWNDPIMDVYDNLDPRCPT